MSDSQSEPSGDQLSPILFVSCPPPPLLFKVHLPPYAYPFLLLLLCSFSQVPPCPPSQLQVYRSIERKQQANPAGVLSASVLLLVWLAGIVPRQASLVPLASQVEGGKRWGGAEAKRSRRSGEIDELGLGGGRNCHSGGKREGANDPCVHL